MAADGVSAAVIMSLLAGGIVLIAGVLRLGRPVALIPLAAGLVSQIPIAALAGLLMVRAARMISPWIIARILRSTRSDAAVFVLTAIITVSVDLIVDATGANTLAELVSGLRRRGVVVLIKGVRPEHRAPLELLGVIAAREDDEHIFAELPLAIAHAREHSI